MSKEQVYPYELIGQEIIVVIATNKFDQGFKGKIIDETKSTLLIEDEVGRVRKLLKNTITFKIVQTGQEIKGKTLIRRPEERIKGK